MTYDTYINMGFSYFEEKNYFNAIQSYEIGISKEHYILLGLNNIGAAFTELGLQKEALLKLNRSISYYEAGRSESFIQLFRNYSNRGRLFRILNKPELMFSDFEKAFSLKKNFVLAWIEQAKYFVFNCNFEKGIDCLTKAIEYNDLKINSLQQRAILYQLLGEHDKAINDLINVNQQLPDTTCYALGKAYYYKGDFLEAKKYYQKAFSYGKWSVEYDQSDFQFGIVQFIDSNLGFGFILGSTWFNEYDSIYFKISDCNKLPGKGERVRFKLNYKEHKHQFLANALDVEPFAIFDNIDFKRNRIYHAIIHNKQNSFKASADLKYVELFYPISTLFSFASIEKIIDEQTHKLLIKNGYAFVELILIIGELDAPIFSNVKSLTYPNSYSNKSVSNKKNYRNNNSGSGRECKVCGLDTWCGNEGCPLDPT